MPPTIAEPVVDYSATIRAEIEGEVARMLESFHRSRRCDPSMRPARYVVLGYTVAAHRGRILYRDGDIIHGLPVKINRSASRLIEVNDGVCGAARATW